MVHPAWRALPYVRDMSTEGDAERLAGETQMASWALDSEERLRALDELGMYPGVPDRAFDSFTRLVSRLLGAPVALLSLVTPDRQFFPSSVGLAEPWSTRRETPLTMSFCQHVVLRNEPLIVTDASTDARVRGNLAISELDAQSYLGTPLRGPGGEPLGSLCALDHHPRQWTVENLADLQDVADAVATALVLRVSEHRQRQQVRDASHRLRTPAAALRFELEDVLQWPQLDPEVGKALRSALDRTEDLTDVVDKVLGDFREGGELLSTEVDVVDLAADVVGRWQTPAPAYPRDVSLEAFAPARARTSPGTLHRSLDLLVRRTLALGYERIVVRVVSRASVCRIQVTGMQRGLERTDPELTGDATTLPAIDELVQRIGGRMAVAPGPPFSVEVALPVSR
jgi:signal transduction histidine kinase